jgi:hypothetical protein
MTHVRPLPITGAPKTMPDYFVDFTTPHFGDPMPDASPNTLNLGKMVIGPPPIFQVVGAPAPATTRADFGGGLNLAITTAPGISDDVTSTVYVSLPSPGFLSAGMKLQLDFVGPYADLRPPPPPPPPKGGATTHPLAHPLARKAILNRVGPPEPFGGWAVGLLFKTGGKFDQPEDVRVGATCRFHETGVKLNILGQPDADTDSSNTEDIVRNDYEGFQSSSPPTVFNPRTPIPFTLEIELDRNGESGTQGTGSATLTIGTTPGLGTFTTTTFPCATGPGVTAIGAALILPAMSTGQAQSGYAAVRLLNFGMSMIL